MKEETRWLRVEMPDGKAFAVPVMVIAKDRANYYKAEFGGCLERSLAEDTLPLFQSDAYEIKDWAANNMNWSDVEAHAIEVKSDAEEADYQEGWMNGEKSIISDDEANNG